MHSWRIHHCKHLDYADLGSQALSSIAFLELYLNHTLNILNYVVYWLLPLPFSKAMPYTHISFCAAILKPWASPGREGNFCHCTEFAWLSFGSGRATEVASVRTYQKFPLCLTQLGSRAFCYIFSPLPSWGWEWWSGFGGHLASSQDQPTTARAAPSAINTSVLWPHLTAATKKLTGLQQWFSSIWNCSVAITRLFLSGLENCVGDGLWNHPLWPPPICKYPSGQAEMVQLE